MAITNKQIDIYQKSVSRHGTVSRTLLRTLDVWWEPAEVVRWQPGEVVVAKGTVFVWEELKDWSNLQLKIDDEYYDVVGASWFYNEVGNFEHAELIYR